MAYRDDSQPLAERAHSLTLALDEVRSQARTLAAEESALAEELERVHARLEQTSPENRSHGLVVAVVGSAACALLGFAAIARIMTSEVAPFEIHTIAPIETSMNANGGGTSTEDDRLGFLQIDAPPGSLIYEGDHFLGTAPLIYPMSNGTHAIRAVPPNGAPQTKLGTVYDHGVGALQFP